VSDEPYEHPLVKKLKVDPAQPPDLNPIHGYIGRSDDDKHVRIYRDPTMNVWVDVPADQIVYQEHQAARVPADPDQDVVWVTSRNARKLTRESSASGVHPELVGRPLIGLGRVGREPEVGRASRYCPCCGNELPPASTGTPIGGGSGDPWPAS
jgi:hypothetical protein